MSSVNCASLNEETAQTTHMVKNSKQAMYDVIFGTNTFGGKVFDIALIVLIVGSVALVILSSIGYVKQHFSSEIWYLEWFFTLLFTIEYTLRIYCSPSPKDYIKSFYGLIDLLSIIPTYLAIFFPGTHYLMVLRLLRVLRIFRILKLIRYVHEGDTLLRAIVASRQKILVFFCFVFVMSVVFGALMFVIEGPEHGFTSIPKSVYWAIVTITTVGYGDIAPQTIIGQMLASWVMITGYTVIVVPMGIFSAQLTREFKRNYVSSMCPNCNSKGHESDAFFCRHCGSSLNKPSEIE